MKFQAARRFALAAAVAALLAACAPPAPPDDAGNENFVIKAMIVLTGKRPKGAEEVDVLADLSALLGRKWVVRMLMERPEFEEQWTHHLVDYMRVQRGGRRSQPAGCFAEPLYVNAEGKPISDQGVIAQVIRDNPPNVAVPGTNALLSLQAEQAAPETAAYNVNDVIRSSIRKNDLSPILSAYVFPFAARGVTSLGGESGRLVQGDVFNDTFLHRNTMCMSCHTASFSVSNEPGWVRTWAIPFLTENGVYGDNFPNPTKTRKGISPIFRQDIALADDETADPTLRPWGMKAACGRYRTNFAGLGAITPVITNSDGDETEVDPYFAGVTGTRIGVGDMVAAYRSGYQKIKQDGISITGQTATDLYLTPPDESLAYMVASTLSMFVWETVMGEPLTIANYYARTESQMMMRWHLTHFFVADGFNLRGLLERILLSDYFNRRAPLYSQQDVPYHLPLILNPWIQTVACPSEDDVPPHVSEAAYGEACRNGRGAVVHRWRSRTLLSTIGHALGWSQPDIYAPTSGFPDINLARFTGQYHHDLDAGNKSVIFQGLLGYESVVGACEKTTGSEPDWIDHLLGVVQPGGGNGPPPRLQDLVLAVKDRLIQYPVLGSYPPPEGDGTPNAFLPGATKVATTGKSEAQVIADLFGASLNTHAFKVDGLETGLRRYCGVLLKSPQFVLDGPRPPMPDYRPEFRVCLPGQPCTYFDMCKGYGNVLARLGQHVQCQNGSVVKTDPPLPLQAKLETDFCPFGTCLYLASEQLEACLADAGICRRTELVPPCDPRRPEHETCGERPDGKLGPGAFLAILEGATVRRAEDVQVLLPGAQTYRPLSDGSRLQIGSALRISPGAHLAAANGGALVRTPEGGMPSRAELYLTAHDRALLEAAEDGRVLEAGILLERGADADARDRYGETPLIKAARKGHHRMVSLLLDRGADWSLRDYAGQSLADAARHADAQPLIEELRARRVLLSGLYDEQRYEQLRSQQAQGGQLQDQRPKQGDWQRREAPWYMIVGGTSLLDKSLHTKGLSQIDALRAAHAGRVRTGDGDFAATLRQWRSTGHSRGVSGEVLTPEQERAAMEEYLSRFSALEHD